MPPSWADLLRLVADLDASGYQEAEIVADGISVRVSRTPGGLASTSTHIAAQPVSLLPSEAVAPSAGVPEPSAGPVAPARDDLLEVTAPILGVVYLRPAPGQPPFVAVGDSVDADSSVAVIEVMKMMNTVSAGLSGRVVEIAVQDGALVEHGTVLFRLERL